MLELGLLARNKANQLVQSASHCEWPSDLASEASKKNHEQNLANAKLALRSIDIEEREFGGVTFTMSENEFREAKESVRTFWKSFMGRFEKAQGQGDVTCQVQIQFFPLTKTKKMKTKTRNKE